MVSEPNKMSNVAVAEHRVSTFESADMSATELYASATDDTASLAAELVD